MSRFMRLALSIPLLTFAYCSSSTSTNATSSNATITGLWRTPPIGNGSAIELSLHTMMNVIEGTGFQDINAIPFDSFTVAGRWNADSSFHLSLTFRHSPPATYDG